MNAPLPPANLSTRVPEIITLAQGVIVERFFTIGDGKTAYDPIYFDRTRKGRWNAPDGSYGVLYTAAQLRGAFAETFLREPGRTLLPLDLLQEKARVRLQITRELKLIKFAGTGLGKLGATAEVVHGGMPYDVPQAWSKALHNLSNGPAKISYDGIAYNARHDDEAICYALFEHVKDFVVEESRDKELDRDWFWQVAELYDVGISP